MLINNKLPTAEDIIEKYQKEFNDNGIVFDLAKPMREFAKLHVIAFQDEIINKVLFSDYDIGDFIFNQKEDILNAYPLTNIK